MSLREGGLDGRRAFSPFTVGSRDAWRRDPCAFARDLREVKLRPFQLFALPAACTLLQRPFRLELLQSLNSKSSVKHACRVLLPPRRALLRLLVICSLLHRSAAIRWG